MDIKAVRGTKDILPEEACKWQALEQIAHDTFGLYGFKEIRTPILEDTNLFKRSLGEGADIVKKEMYTFEDRKSRSISLRPEATASIVRAYLENSLDKTEGFVKLYYIGPMFRAERPQKGRLRQFHQIGVEVIGSSSSFLDAEVIILLNTLLSNLKIKSPTLLINSIGCMDDRKKYGELLRKNLKKHLASLCEDCNSRFNKNVLRILDCKKESCRKIIKAVPAISDSLCSNCNDHYRQVKELLKQQKVEYVEDRNLVRGLDYYTNIVFEVTHNSLGSQDAIGAGGRYDGLIKLFGGPDTPGVGFALGLERLLLASELSTSSCTDDNFMVYFATIGDDSYKKAFELVQELRKNNVGAVIDYQGKSLKAQMNQANKLGVSLVAILGSDELKAGTITLRDMKTSKQNNIKITNLLDFTKSKSKNC